MICPICDKPRLMREGEKVYCLYCGSSGECTISNKPVLEEDTNVNIRYGSLNYYQNGLHEIDWNNWYECMSNQAKA